MDEEDLSINTKALQKDVKRAKLFVIQHLTRRIKMLKNKRGTDQQVEKNTRKATRLEEELECIKDLKINIILKKIENKDLSNCATAVGVENVQERAMARLTSSKCIQSYLKLPNQQNNIDQAQKSSKSEAFLPEVKLSQSTPRKKASCKLKARQDNLDLASHISQLQSDSSSDNPVASDSEVLPQRAPTSRFVKTLSSAKEQYTSRLKPVNHSSSKLKIDKKPKKERKKSSNRMGQRARQRLWKERYGNKAKHLKSHDKTAELKHDKKHSEITSNKTQKPRQETKRERGIKRTSRENTQVEEEASHPSWEASKRRKLQQNITQTTFQGQKIIFEGSE